MLETNRCSTSHHAYSAQTISFRVFLSHAGEDKETIARPLCKCLRQHGVSVFLDDESFRLGDHCPEVMEHAMETAPVGVFILSPEFVAKQWPMRELLAFVRRYDLATAAKETPPLLISIFYRLSTRQCRDPAIFDTYSNLFLRHGLFKRALDNVVPLKDVKHALHMAATLWSIENDVGATNSSRPTMASTRESFIQIIASSIFGHLGIKTPQLVDKRHVLVASQPAQVDVYTPCNMVPPNPPRLTLKYGLATTCEGRLRAAVLGNSGSRIVAVVATGKGGVGKTCALRGLSYDNEIKHKFRGGILYIELGNEAALSNIVQGIATIVDWTGGSNLANEIKTLKSVEEASKKASKWFSQSSCLFLVDDIWRVNGIDSDVLTTLGLMVNTNSRMVYTTRDRHFLIEAEETIEFEEKETFGDLSKEMLMTHAGFDHSAVLDYKNKVALKYFLTLCQGLPLGFGIVGGSVRLYSFDCLRGQDAWSAFYNDVSSQQKDLMDTKAGSYGKLPKIVDLSLQVLEKRSGHGKFWDWFRALSVLQKQQSVPAQMLQKLWDLDTLQEARAVVESFAEVSVVQMTRSDHGAISLRLHDLILDIAARAATIRSETQEFFKTLVRNYTSSKETKERDDVLVSAKQSTDVCGQPQGVLHDTGAHKDTRRKGIKKLFKAQIKKLVKSQHESEREIEKVVLGTTQKATASSDSFHPWWNDEDDGYIHNNLCRILRNAGYVDQLLWLLSQPQWIAKRLVNHGILSVEEDLDHGIAMGNDNNSQDKIHMEHLQMIGLAARLGASFVSNNPSMEEAWFQLHGRLLLHAKQSELTNDFVQRMESCAPKPWLKASAGLLQQAGGTALKAISAPGTVMCTRVEPDAIWILSADDSGTLYVGRCEGSKEYQQHEKLEGSRRPKCLFLPDSSFLPDHRRVVTAYFDRRICVWNRKTGICEQIVPHPCPHHLFFVSFLADGTLLACQRQDYSIQLWNTLSGKPVGKPLQGHTDWVKSVVLSADGARIVSGSDDKTVRVWDSESGDAVMEPLRGHVGWVRCVAVSADGNRIVSGSSDKTVRVWDAHSGDAVMEPLRGHTDSVSCLAISEDGTRIASGSYDWTVRVWNAQSGDALGEPLQGHTYCVSSVKMSANGTRLVTGSGDKTVRVWNAQSGDNAEPLQDHPASVWCVAVSVNGTRILSGCRDGTIRIWNAHSGHAVGKPLRAHTDWVRCVTVSADGSRIVSCSDDKTILVWDADSGAVVGQPLHGHTGSVRCVAVSADGGRIVSGSNDETVRIWDIRSGETVGKTLQGHTAWVGCVAISADGSLAVSGSGDHTVRIWSSESGEAVCEPLQGHTDSVWCVAVSADGTRIVSGSWDKTVRVWDAERGEAIGEPLQGHTGRVESVAVNADGTRIVSEDREMLRLWALSAGGKLEWELTSRNAMWRRTMDSLELTWSTQRWSPFQREVRHYASDGSETVLGSCEQAVDNIHGGDVYFTEFFKSCQIVGLDASTSGQSPGATAASGQKPWNAVESDDEV